MEKCDNCGEGSTYRLVDVTGKPFVAISHVWSHGLGIPISNSLPSCQVEHLFGLINAIGPPDVVASKIDDGLDSLLKHSNICGMPGMVHLGLAKPQEGNIKLLFMGFAQEKWPRIESLGQTSFRPLKNQCHKHRKNRFTNQQLEEHRRSREYFFRL